MSNTHLQLVFPSKEKRTVIPRRLPNHELRPREHLTEREVETLVGVARKNRNGLRDAAMILICFRHGLRASELCELQWSDLEFETATLHLRRAKKGTVSTHPLLGDELRALRALRREAKSPFIFVSERNAPFTVSGLQKMIERAGIAAKMPFKIHPNCSDTRLGTLWRTRVPIRGRYKATWDIGRFNRLSATQSWHRVDSGIFGDKCPGRGMSALPRKADIAEYDRHVRFVR
jgi:integrase